MQLDALALVYEAYAKGPQSRFAQYMCMLPKQYALPVLYKDTWSQAVVRALPDLARLVDKRAVQVTLYGQLAKKAMLQFQGRYTWCMGSPWAGGLHMTSSLLQTPASR